MASENRNRHAVIWGCILVFCISFAMITLIFLRYGYAPFGNKSMVAEDMNYTQMDLYAYFKDVLLGKNSLGYSFSMYLGGDTANVYSYSMGSPLNFLVLLFDKSQFHVFFDLTMAIRIGALAAAMYFYLSKRMKGKLPVLYAYILSICYAFSQYAIAQTCNIFWLDGMIMLPFMMWGLYKVVRERKSTFFIIAIACSMIFNWYSGVINCIFCVFWFFLEMALFHYEEPGTVSVKSVPRVLLRTLISGIAGILISAVLFLPTMDAVKEGNRGTIFWSFLSNTFNGNILTALTNDVIGSKSSPEKVSLYCGSIVLIGTACFFMSRTVEKERKRIWGIFLAVVILSFYWQPLTFLFSMFKYASSYWFRYGYIGIFTMIVIAAEYYTCVEKDVTFETNSVIFLLVYGVCVFFMNRKTSGYALKLLYATVFFYVACIIGILLWRRFKARKIGQTIALVLAAGICVELSYNAKVLMPSFTNYAVHDYEEYVKEEEKRVTQLKGDDPDAYRVTQTLTRNMTPRTRTANYNEAFGYGYWSLVGYTNSPDDMQRTFFDRAGYRINGENMYIVNTSLLAIDSLLGVKYVFADYDINGLKADNKYGVVNRKTVYSNPYAFPMAFLYKKGSKAEDDNKQCENAFDFHNKLYSELAGKLVNLYQKLEYTEKSQEDGKKTTYELTVPGGKFAVYGNLPWKEETGERILVNGQQMTEYAEWCSPSLFYIPTQDGDQNVTVEVESDNKISVEDVQFYALDLNALEQARKEIISHTIDQSDIQNGHVRLEFDSESGEEVFTSIPYNRAWKITDNGKAIKAEKFADCLMLLPISEGHHIIEMHYVVPGLYKGIVCAAIGILLLVLCTMYEKKDCGRKKRSGFKKAGR